MNIHSKLSKPFDGCFSRFMGGASGPTDFHSLEWTLVRNKKAKERKKILKSDFGSSHWHKIPCEEVNFVVTPKETKMTYQVQEVQKRAYQPSLKMHSAKGSGNKKPGTAPKKISYKKIDALLKKMLSN
jgi:hypothetical protein